MKTIALIGAFDRYNYGDVLMPIVLGEVIKQKVEDVRIYYVALREEGMQYVGGYDTIALKDIKRKGIEIDVLIIVGGDILGADYTNMYTNLIPIREKKRQRLIKDLDRFFPHLFNIVCKLLLGGTDIKPWILSKNNGQIVIYNTVGGNPFETKRIFQFQKKKLIDMLNESEYLSVRDKKTYNILLNAGVQNVKLYPDSVLGIGQYFSTGELEKEVSNECRLAINEMKSYFVFQTNYSSARNHIEELAKQIDYICEKLHMNCILLPIGYAAGHDDREALALIQEQCQSNTWMPDFMNVFEIIYTIRMSEAFIGTSLHGIITAIAYEKLHFTILGNHKVKAFLETWNTTKYVMAETGEIYKIFDILLKDKDNMELLREQKKKMIGMIEDNFEQIIKIIKEY